MKPLHAAILAFMVSGCEAATADRLIIEVKGRHHLSYRSLSLASNADRLPLGPDIEVYCFQRSNDGEGLTVLRAGRRFYALDGIARAHYVGGIAIWKGVRYRIEDRGADVAVNVAIGQSIVDGLESCR